jgi:hypothetical protein
LVLAVLVRFDMVGFGMFRLVLAGMVRCVAVSYGFVRNGLLRQGRQGGSWQCAVSLVEVNFGSWGWVMHGMLV